MCIMCWKTLLCVCTILLTKIFCVSVGNNSVRENEIGDHFSDVFLNTQQLLRKYNYTSEKHQVKTEDGYQLNLFRIPRKGPPILLAHGIGDSSDSWVVLGPEHSLAYLLADDGFDVWLFNSRGNRYSKGNSKKLPKKKYWNFSYEEIGTYDLPATIDYILATTLRSKLTYIGFSQGTTTFLVMCSLKPEFNKKINHAILLAPVAWVNNVKHPLTESFVQNLKELTSFVKRNQFYESFPFNVNFNLYHALVCNISSPLNFLCALEIYITFGLRKLSNLLPEKLPVITTHIPAGLSTKIFLHYLQGCSSKKFQRYDMGFKKNQIYYSSPTPPEYNLALITVPMTVFASETDWFSTIEDLKILQKVLKAPNKCLIINKTVQFTHLEFIYGSRAKSLINVPVIRILKNISYR